jgi:NAD+ kinase
MKVAVYTDKPRGGLLRELVRGLEAHQIPYHLTTRSERIDEADLLVVLGSDRDILKALHHLGGSTTPILGVSEADTSTFLADIGVEEFKEAIGKIVKEEYWVEEAARISVEVDGEQLPPALNEAALFAARSATLIEYVLQVDGEDVWRDHSDGVIVATPVGSTAYALSAGGPVILHKASVFTIVSVNSLDVTRRPLIVPDTSTIALTQISTAHRAEMVVDGIYRARVNERVVLGKFPTPARLIRLKKTSSTLERYARKLKLAEALLKMPPSAKLVLKTLQYEGPLTQKDLVRITMLPERTTRMALSLLIKNGLVQQRPLLRDSRHKIYYAVTQAEA